MPLNDDMLHYFAKMIEDEIGIVYRPDLYYQLTNRLETIQSLFGYKDLLALFQQAQKGLPREVKNHLMDLATNNETSFFRDKRVFTAIEDRILPELLAQNNHIDIWSVASSSGQEAYSMCMTLEEYSLRKKIPLTYEVLATDVSSQILEKAKNAVYSQLEVQRGLPAPMLIKYFQPEEDSRWRLRTEIKNKVKFRQVNLVEPFFLEKKFDLVLCRNVLIYQSKERKQEILKRVDRCLKPGGYLVMGSGETMVGLRDDYRQEIFDGAVFYQKETEKELAKTA